MYLHLVYSPECLADASGRKSTRKLFRQATELIVTMDHEFVGKATSPPFAFLPYPFHEGILLPLGKRFIRVIWDTYGCEEPNFLSCATANLVYL